MSSILFIADSHLEQPRGTPLHLCHVLRALRADHSVTVCAASVPEEFRPVFIRYPVGNRFLRIVGLLQIMRAQRPEYVLVPNVGTFMPVVLKLICGVRIAVDLQGLGHEELYADGSIGYLRYLHTKYKAWLLLHCYDIVFVVSKKLADHYAPISKDWVLVRGGVDTRDIPHASNRPYNQNQLVLGYMGNARAYQGLPNILEAAAILKNRNVPVRLNLILSGDTRGTEALLTSLNLKDITTLHTNVSHQEAGRLIADSDALSIPRPSTPVTEYAFPGKLAECLATGIPTVMTEVGPVYELRPEIDDRVIIIPPHDIARGLADAFERVYRMDVSERRALGGRARDFALNTLSWESLGRIFSNAF